MSASPRDDLDEAQLEALAAGEHERVAADLLSRDRPDLAGWVLEQIWDFDGAQRCYFQAGKPLDALRMALEGGRPDALDDVVSVIEAVAGTDPDTASAAIEQLERRSRHAEAARLMAALARDPVERAGALKRAGNLMGAAQLLAESGLAKEALDVLAPLFASSKNGAAHELAARLSWDLGDAEGAARHAQTSLRGELDNPELRALLARALGSLGHDLAAQIVLQGERLEATAATVPGRYRVTGMLPPRIVGATYVGYDRVTLQEVEIHLLLADRPDTDDLDPATLEALESFASTAHMAAEVGHPAIRPILRVVPRAGLLVMPRAEGPDLGGLIRPPGMLEAPTRARGLVAFLLEGLAAAHQRGLVHGALYASQMQCDALGRPLLGPFGTYLLHGLAATRTAGLEELLAGTAPEVRAGATPTPASDVYAMGAMLQALLTGQPGETCAASTLEADLARAMMAMDPSARPTAAEALATLRTPIADIRDMEPSEARDGTQTAADPGESALAHRIEIVPAESWTDSLLDELCASASPWLQPILDRSDRRIHLAAWPSGCGTRDARAQAGPGWRELLPPEALAGLPERLREAMAARLRPASLVSTAAGDWMIALDDLLRQ